MKLVIVSKGGGASVDAACGEWADKIRRYAPFDEIVVRPNPKNAKDPRAQLEAEGERVMRHVDARDFVVLMDERGKDLSSEALAAVVADVGDGGHSGIVFCVGGPFGHGDAGDAKGGRESATEQHGDEPPGGEDRAAGAGVPRAHDIAGGAVPSLMIRESGLGGGPEGLLGMV